MAKKIIISFDNLPNIGNAFSYTIYINGIKIIYNSGVDIVATYFKNRLTPAEPPQSIQLKDTLNEAISEAVYTLTTYFQNQSISYKVIGTSIEILVNADNVNIELLGSNENITLTQEEVVTTLGLKYLVEYKNIVGDLYKCQILQKNYVGDSKVILGDIIIDKSSSKDHLEPIRGTGITLNLLATKDLTLEDLYTEDEQEFTVKLYKNNKIYFVGYLKPDGVFQDYVNEQWYITLDCIDGLGAIKNLSFVKENGTYYVGKMTVSEIIYICLRRTGILLNINTSVNIIYEGLSQTDSLDIFTKINFNTDRFVKTDNQTIMSCEEVLTSILDIFCAVITQKDGEWYIYKPNELYLNSTPLFRQYDSLNNYLGIKKVDLRSRLGSQIDNFYPHHSNSNQKITIKGGVNAFRLAYQYGFLEGLVNNNNLQHGASENYDKWVTNPAQYNYLTLGGYIPSIIVNDPISINGVRMLPLLFNFATPLVILTNENIPLLKGDSFSFKTSVFYPYSDDILNFTDPIFFNFRVKIGDYFLSEDGKWYQQGQIGNNYLTFSVVGDQTIEVNAEPLPISGNVVVEILAVSYNEIDRNNLFLATVKSVDIINNSQINPKQGEFHTVERQNKISSIIKENKEVYNGDNIGIVFYGAIFKENKDDLTTVWQRKGITESKTILQISAEEELRISQKPLKIFNGSVYGYIDYLTICDIKNIGNKFMPIDWSYDTKNNITNVSFLELYAPEIADIKYTLTYDYGNDTVKPTITG
jgi:hypothetical protein